MLARARRSSCNACRAAGLFFYSTMDSIDGKQARRTDTASPLGELFDQCVFRALHLSLLDLSVLAAAVMHLTHR